MASPDRAEEDLLKPPMIKGLASSLAMHAILLLVMGFWYLKAQQQGDTRAIDTRLVADVGLGDPMGNDTGRSFTMGGIDNTQTTPDVEAIVSPVDSPPVLTPIKLGDLGLVPKGATRATTDPEKAGEGVKVTDKGKGGGVGGEGFGMARFGRADGGLVQEKIGGIEVKVGDPQFTLIWDSPADLDLHVIEPGGSEIFWVERNGKRGGELDVDNLTGFGPENIYWVEERGPDGKLLAKGQGPPGEYKWFVHYYGGNKGEAVTTHWKVRVKHDGAVTVFQGTLKKRQRSKTYTFQVGTPAAAEATAKKDDGPR